MLKTNLKLGEVNNLSDARFAAGIGAEFIGFNLTPSHPKFIAPNAISEILGWLSGPCLVSEWDDVPVDVITDTNERLGFHYIQLNCFNRQQAEILKDHQLIQCIRLIPHQSSTELISKLESIKSYVKYFMLEFASVADQEEFLASKPNCLILKEFCKDYLVFLNFEFTTSTLPQLLEEYSPFGINLKGGTELKPGFKDFDELNDLVELLEQE
jgi:phosphoribosylanthranilate isomerase